MRELGHSHGIIGQLGSVHRGRGDLAHGYARCRELVAGDRAVDQFRCGHDGIGEFGRADRRGSQLLGGDGRSRDVFGLDDVLARQGAAVRHVGQDVLMAEVGLSRLQGLDFVFGRL